MITTLGVIISILLIILGILHLNNINLNKRNNELYIKLFNCQRELDKTNYINEIIKRKST